MRKFLRKRRNFKCVLCKGIIVSLLYCSDTARTVKFTGAELASHKPDVIGALRVIEDRRSSPTLHDD